MRILHLVDIHRVGVCAVCAARIKLGMQWVTTREAYNKAPLDYITCKEALSATKFTDTLTVRVVFSQDLIDTMILNYAGQGDPLYAVQSRIAHGELVDGVGIALWITQVEFHAVYDAQVEACIEAGIDGDNISDRLYQLVLALEEEIEE